MIITSIRARHFAAKPDFVDSWPPHCVVGSPGAEFHDNLTYRDFAAVFYKGHYAPAYSAFEGVTATARGCRHGCRSERLIRSTSAASQRTTAYARQRWTRVRKGFDTTVLLDLTAAVASERVAEVSAELAAAGVTIRA